MTVEEEHDHQKNKIGFFVEYALDRGDSLTDYSEILKAKPGAKRF